MLLVNARTGFYAQGNSDKDLGHIVEFKNGAELTYQFDSGVRIGVSAYHISNASISDSMHSLSR